jgi:hypothetical protein
MFLCWPSLARPRTPSPTSAHPRAAPLARGEPSSSAARDETDNFGRPLVVWPLVKLNEECSAGQDI